MTPARATLLATAALAAVVTYLIVVPPAPGATGLPHPEFPGMMRGGDGAARHQSQLTLAWIFGALQILLIASMVALGAQRRGRLGRLGRPLLRWNLAYLTAWTAMLVAYRGDLADPSARLFGLPIATALLIYAIWPIPGFYAWLYYRGFREWVLTDEDEAVFRELVAERRAGAGNEKR